MRLNSLGKLLITVSFSLTAIVGCYSANDYVTVADSTQTKESSLSDARAEILHTGWWQRLKHLWIDTTHEFANEYHKNQRWPEPYNALAERSFHEPLNIQAKNARLQMASLWDYHFRRGIGKLNLMGKERLRNIINQSHLRGYAVYVHSTANPIETQARLDAVRKRIGQLRGNSDEFKVITSTVNPSSVSGAEAQNATKRLTTPQPNATAAPTKTPAQQSGARQ